MRHPNEERNSNNGAVVPERSQEEKNRDLLKAAEAGDVESFKRLLKEKAHILARNGKGQTVLDVAQEKIEHTTFNGKYKAIKQAIIQHLFEELSGFDLKESSSDFALFFVTKLFEQNFQTFPSIFPTAVLEFSDSEGRTLLHHACILKDGAQSVADEGHASRILGFVSYLLSKKAPQKKDKLGNLPIHYLIQSGVPFDLTYAALLHRDALIWQSMEVYENAFGNSLLHHAVFYERMDWLEPLMDGRAPFYQKNHAEETFLDLAAMKGSDRIFRLIFEKMVRHARREGSLEFDMIKQALSYAIYYQQIHIVDYIFTRFSSPALINAGLLQAISSDNVEFVWAFIERGAGVNMEGQYIPAGVYREGRYIRWNIPEPIPFNQKKLPYKFKKAMPMELACEIRAARIILLLLKNGAYLFRKSFFGNETIDEHFKLIMTCLEGSLDGSRAAEVARVAKFAPIRARMFKALEKEDDILAEILNEGVKNLGRGRSNLELFHTTNEKGLSPYQIAERHERADCKCVSVLESYGASSVKHRPIPLERENQANNNNAPVAVVENPAEDAEYFDAISDEEPVLFFEQRRGFIPDDLFAGLPENPRGANNNNAPAEPAPAAAPVPKKAPYVVDDQNSENAPDEEELKELRKLVHLNSERKKRNIKKADIPKEFMCEISQKLMLDPVLASDGGNYDRGSIEPYFAIPKEKRGPLNGKFQKKFPNDILIASREFRQREIRCLEKLIKKHDEALEKLKSEAQLLQSPNGQALFSPAAPMQENELKEAEAAPVSPRVESTESADHESADNSVNDNGPRLA